MGKPIVVGHASEMRRFLLVLMLGCLGACGDDGELRPAPVDGGVDGQTDLPVPGGGACVSPKETAIEVDSYGHKVEPIDYVNVPPVGGDHNDCWAAYDVHKSEVPDERWVHNLEHGAVVLLYRCPEGCEAEIAALTKFIDSHERTLVTPYAALPTRFGIVSWGYRQLTDCFDLAEFERFYRTHHNHGRESVPGGPPSSCL